MSGSCPEATCSSTFLTDLILETVAFEILGSTVYLEIFVLCLIKGLSCDIFLKLDLRNPYSLSSSMDLLTDLFVDLFFLPVN